MQQSYSGIFKIDFIGWLQVQYEASLFLFIHVCMYLILTLAEVPGAILGFITKLKFMYTLCISA